MQQIAHPSSITTNQASPSHLMLLTRQLKPETRLPKPIISAKRGGRRSGSRRSQKLILDSIALVASNLKILPEPLDSLARELWVAAANGGGGNGGKFWLRKGFGGGGGGEGRNRRAEKLGFGFWAPLIASSALAMWVVLERERGRDSELNFWILLVVSAFSVYYCLIRGWRREIKDWVLGFTCGAALMGLGLRNNENLAKWVDILRVNSTSFMPIAKRRRKAKRWI